MAPLPKTTIPVAYGGVDFFIAREGLAGAHIVDIVTVQLKVNGAGPAATVILS